jgi:hypothetical protein
MGSINLSIAQQQGNLGPSWAVAPQKRKTSMSEVEKLINQGHLKQVSPYIDVLNAKCKLSQTTATPDKGIQI